MVKQILGYFCITLLAHCSFAMNLSSEESCKMVQEYRTAAQKTSKSHTTCRLIYSKEGKDVGYVDYIVNSYAKTVVIENVYILPDYRNKKLGSAMFKKALDDILAFGYSHITLIADPREIKSNSEAHQKALAQLVNFYKGFGFTVVSSQRRDPEDPSSPLVTSMKYMQKN